MIRTTLSLFLLLISTTLFAQSGVVTTIAGTPGVAGYWDGPAADAMFTHPTWLDVVVGPKGTPTCDEGKSGEIFVVDRINQLVRRIDQSGNVTTFKIVRRQFVGAGPVVSEVPLDFDSAFGGGVLVEQPGDGCGCGAYARGVFVASTGANQVVLGSPNGEIAARDDWSPILGTGKAGGADGDSASAAQFNKPVGLARSKDLDQPFGDIFLKRRVYVADSGNHTIRQISWELSFEACPQGKTVKTLAGAAGQPGSADGTRSAARFNMPRGIAVAPDNSIYVTDSGNHTVRRITRDGVVTTVAGTPGVAGSDDTHLNTPSGIDVDANGNVYVVDTFNHAVRMIGSDGKLVTVAGQLGVSGFADGDAATAKFNAPVGLKVAPDGSIVIADTGNNVIRRLTLK